MHILYNSKSLELIVIIDLENANPSTLHVSYSHVPKLQTFPLDPTTYLPIRPFLTYTRTHTNLKRQPSLHHVGSKHQNLFSLKMTRTNLRENLKLNQHDPQMV
jgi:hypothetical protein